MHLQHVFGDKRVPVMNDVLVAGDLGGIKRSIASATHQEQEDSQP